MIEERFLPIGTVLLLKGGRKPVMITSYCIYPTNVVNNSERKMYEYGGCVYSEGILDSNMACAFNHNQIEKILYMGYTSEVQKELSNLLKAKYDKYKEDFENSNRFEVVDNKPTE